MIKIKQFKLINTNIFTTEDFHKMILSFIEEKHICDNDIINISFNSQIHDNKGYHEATLTYKMYYISEKSF